MRAHCSPSSLSSPTRGPVSASSADAQRRRAADRGRFVVPRRRGRVGARAARCRPPARDRQHHEADDGNRRARAAQTDDVVRVSPQRRGHRRVDRLPARGRGAHRRRPPPGDAHPERERRRRGARASRRGRICRSFRRSHECESRGARALTTRTSRTRTGSTRAGTSRARVTRRRSCATRSVCRSSGMRSRARRSRLPGGRTFPTTDDLLVELGAARRREDRAHARRRLVAGGGCRAGRRHRVRHRPRQRHARGAERRAAASSSSTGSTSTGACR